MMNNNDGGVGGGVEEHRRFNICQQLDGSNISKVENSQYRLLFEVARF